MPKVAFVSDLHLGGYNTLGPDKVAYRAGIVQLLKYLRGQGITHLTMPGDILDSWTFPRTEVPLTYEQMLSHPDNAEIVATLKEIAADPKIQLSYCWGNHDASLPDDLFRTWFPATQMGDNFTLGFVWAEHGHRFDLFNANEPLNLDPAKGHRPMGYYITRIHTQAKVEGKLKDFEAGLNSSAYIRSKVEQAIEEMHPKDRGFGWTVAGIVLDYVVSDAGIKYTDTITMPDGSTVTVQQVADAYKNIFSEWQAKYGLMSALNAVLNSMDHLDISAQSIRAEHGKRLVVLGHSHIAKWNALTVGPGVEGAYVNDGALCKWPQTAVIVDYLPKSYQVTRLGFDDAGQMSSEVKEIGNVW